jgi:hypothetical protein
MPGRGGLHLLPPYPSIPQRKGAPSEVAGRPFILPSSSARMATRDTDVRDSYSRYNQRDELGKAKG